MLDRPSIGSDCGCSKAPRALEVPLTERGRVPNRDRDVTTAANFTAGRYVVSWTDGAGARDPIMLTAQVKAMRDGFERAGHRPALLLVVVADGEQDAAAALIEAALGDDPT